MEQENTIHVDFDEVTNQKNVELVAVPISGSQQEVEYNQSNNNVEGYNPVNGTHLVAQPVVHFQKIPPELVDLMVKEIENDPTLEFRSAQTGNDYNPRMDDEIRNSKVTWWYEDHWVTSIICHYINMANRCNWEYDLTFLSGLQITHYDKDGHYIWHSDYGTSNDQRYTRKLSATLLITDPSEYEGGELEFVDYHNNLLRSPKEKGTLVIFDSRIPHRVTPIVKGRRTSIVAWMLGPKLR